MISMRCGSIRWCSARVKRRGSSDRIAPSNTSSSSRRATNITETGIARAKPERRRARSKAADRSEGAPSRSPATSCRPPVHAQSVIDVRCPDLREARIVRGPSDVPIEDRPWRRQANRFRLPSAVGNRPLHDRCSCRSTRTYGANRADRQLRFRAGRRSARARCPLSCSTRSPRDFSARARSRTWEKFRCAPRANARGPISRCARDRRIHVRCRSPKRAKISLHALALPVRAQPDRQFVAVGCHYDVID